MADYITITTLSGNVYKITNIKDYTVEQSIDIPADSFEFIVSNTKYEVSKVISAGDKLKFYLSNKLAMEGIIDDVDMAYTLDDNDLRITGRDKMSILLDNDASPTTLYKLGLDDYTKKVMKKYGLGSSYSGSNSSFDKITINPGETEYSVIERLAKKRNLISLFDPYDNQFKNTKLISSKNNTYTFSNDLSNGIRIKDAEISISADVRNEVIVYGGNYEKNKNIKGSYKDSKMKVKKRKITSDSDAETSKEAEKKAKEEFYDVNKNALSVKIITNTKTPIFINRSALVQINKAGLKAYLLIDSVTYTKSISSGSITTIKLKLMPGISVTYGKNIIPTLPKL